MRRLVNAVVVFAIVALPVFRPQSVHAVWTPTCGGVLSSSDAAVAGFVLAGCTNPPHSCVVTVTAGAILQLNGGTILCGGSGQTGICVDPGSSVYGPGLVSGCDTGIRVNNTGTAFGSISKVTASGNNTGILAAGGTLRIERNVVLNNTAVGIETTGGKEHRIRANFVSCGNGVGIKIGTEKNKVLWNTVVQSVTDGILDNGALGSSIKNNNVSLSGAAGIHVKATAAGTVIKYNVSTFNSTFDLLDDDPTCTSHTWLNNTEVTSSPACAQ